MVASSTNKAFGIYGFLRWDYRSSRQASQTGRQTQSKKTNFMCIIMYGYMCVNDFLFDNSIFRLRTSRRRWRIFLICCLNMIFHKVCMYVNGQYTIELCLYKYWAIERLHVTSQSIKIYFRVAKNEQKRHNSQAHYVAKTSNRLL